MLINGRYMSRNLRLGDALFDLRSSLKASPDQLTNWNQNQVNPCTWSKIHHSDELFQFEIDCYELEFLRVLESNSGNISEGEFEFAECICESLVSFGSTNLQCITDTDTDEIYAQASLQSVNSEKDVLPIPDFGMKPSRHPSEFFCNTLTPNVTSTHGGFPVPRRAAEKLFPQFEQWVNESFELLILASHGFEDVVPK
ncbi:hypothetical protein L2E82_15446 [Cichorium intybus]|uniref:Uncharacterized protein n=1 Tax=Cichorium intybus TaxID=13427 RepID=A0ACB9F262_CICIN|nr:hypothetical protein L2E82_15446 [Cichorium intybus]